MGQAGHWLSQNFNRVREDKMAERSSTRDLQATRVDPFDVSRAEDFGRRSVQEPIRQMRATARSTEYATKFGPYWSVDQYKPIQHIEALPKIFSSSWEVGGITVAGDGIDNHARIDMPCRCSSRWTRRNTRRSAARLPLPLALPKSSA